MSGCSGSAQHDSALSELEIRCAQWQGDTVQSIQLFGDCLRQHVAAGNPLSTLDWWMAPAEAVELVKAMSYKLCGLARSGERMDPEELATARALVAFVLQRDAEPAGEPTASADSATAAREYLVHPRNISAVTARVCDLTEGLLDLFDIYLSAALESGIDCSDWRAVRELEAEFAQISRQLSDMFGRLNELLPSDGCLCADYQHRTRWWSLMDNIMEGRKICKGAEWANGIPQSLVCVNHAAYMRFYRRLLCHEIPSCVPLFMQPLLHSLNTYRDQLYTQPECHPDLADLQSVTECALWLAPGSERLGQWGLDTQWCGLLWEQWDLLVLQPYGTYLGSFIAEYGSCWRQQTPSFDHYCSNVRSAHAAESSLIEIALLPSFDWFEAAEAAVAAQMAQEGFRDDCGHFHKCTFSWLALCGRHPRFSSESEACLAAAADARAERRAYLTRTVRDILDNKLLQNGNELLEVGSKWPMEPGYQAIRVGQAIVASCPAETALSSSRFGQLGSFRARLIEDIAFVQLSKQDLQRLACVCRQLCLMCHTYNDEEEFAGLSMFDDY